VLITSPYGTRSEIFRAIEGKTKGIYCEKPFAKSLQEHNALISNYKDYEFTIGYQRRSLESVRLMKNVIEGNLFGSVQKVCFEYGDIGIRTGGFQSNVELSGGGLLFEAGIHWIDTVLYTLNAIDVRKLKSTVEYQCGLDIHVEAKFEIILPKGELVDFGLTVTQIQQTTNKIMYTFKDVSLELELFDDTARPIVVPHNNPSERYMLHNYLRDIGPSSSLGQGIEYWDQYLFGFRSQSASYTSAKDSLLTTKVVEFIYE
jgi:predicted dehydrogenase